MNKKILSVFLIICILFTFSACGKNDGNTDQSGVSDTSSLISDTDAIVGSQSSSESESNSESGSSQAPLTSTPESSSVPDPVPSPSSSAPSTPPPSSSNKVEGESITVPDDKVVEEPEGDKVTVTPTITTDHTALSSSEYYQRSTLSENTLALYDRIDQTILTSKRIINTSDLELTVDDIAAVVHRFLTDHPQYFYITNRYYMSKSSSSDKINNLILLYTDGQVTDDYDHTLEPISIADRNKISQQISEVNETIKSILSTIPSNISEIEKERIIHDYIVNALKYNDPAAEALGTDAENQYFYAFNLYGAVTSKNVVCEGYSKLFQYLCYCVGINATQVVGQSSSFNHMWNAVKIGGEWYHIDLTWADSNEYTVINYSYFNLTRDEMLKKDHYIGGLNISDPPATATKYAFNNYYAINVTESGKLPSNFKEKMDYTKSLNSGKNMLYLYIRIDPSIADGYPAMLSYANDNFFEGEIPQYAANIGITQTGAFSAYGDHIIIQFSI